MNKKLILVVDDDASMARIIKEALGSTEVIVEIAFDCLTAEKMVTEKHYALVICDIFLPDTRSLEIVDILREIDLDYRIILMSGYLEAEDLEPESDEVNTVNDLLMQADRKGVYATLKKPFDLLKLRETVNKALEE